MQSLDLKIKNLNLQPRIFSPVIFILFFLFSLPLAKGEAQNIFELTPDKIESALVSGPLGEFFYISVKLNDQGTREFYELTSLHVGEALQIVSQGKIVMELNVQIGIDSGRLLLGKWKTEKEAGEVLETISR